MKKLKLVLTGEKIKYIIIIIITTTTIIIIIIIILLTHI
jgi:hypothetical protein